MNSVRFLTLVILLSCSRSGYCQEVPTTWQPGMKIEAGYGGGMTEYSYEISITAGESYMITKGENAGTVKKKFSSKQLNALLTFLRDHNFDKITAEHTGPADDKASESITLSWGDNVVGASEGPDMDIPDDQQDDFNAIQAHLQSLFKKK